MFNAPHHYNILLVSKILAEIERMDNGQGISVRSSCGGYNCRHYWLAVPGEIAPKKKEVVVGKQKLLMDEKTQQEFFAYHRRYYVEANKMNYKTLEEYKIADALAYAHDGYNERITNQPSGGIWKQRLYRRRDGNIETNFEHYFLKRKKDGDIDTINEFKKAMTNVVRNSNANIYRSITDDGSLRYLVHDAKTNWLIMLDNYGAVHTAYKQSIDSPLWRKKVLLGLLKNFIGEF